MGIGWVKVHRKILDHWIYDKKPYDEFHAWVDILLTVNHELQKVVNGKTIVFVERGSIITTMRELSERWGWGRHKTVDFLNFLQNDGMIKIYGGKKSTQITVYNWELYQGF